MIFFFIKKMIYFQDYHHNIATKLISRKYNELVLDKLSLNKNKNLFYIKCKSRQVLISLIFLDIMFITNIVILLEI